MLVIGALLMSSTLRNLRSVDVGFNHEDVSTVLIDLSSQEYPVARMRVYYEDLLGRLAAEPGLTEVALARRAPFDSRYSVNVQHPDGQARRVQLNSVTASYFRLLGMPLLHGRAFTDEDTATATALRPAIVSASLAHTLFATTDAIGRTVELVGDGRLPSSTLQVVGVVGDVRWRRLTGDVDPLLYVPFATDAAAHLRPSVLIRTHTPVPHVSQIVQTHAAALDPLVPVSDAELLTARIEGSIAEQRALTWVCSLLGGLGFVLAAMGLFGLISQTVTERTREIGIRLALGAPIREVVFLVLRHAAVIFVVGGLAGLTAAVYGSRFIQSRLFGVQPVEPQLYAVALFAMAVVVLLATALPARTATRVDPVVALRQD
jgi:predicted permease